MPTSIVTNQIPFRKTLVTFSGNIGVNFTAPALTTTKPSVGILLDNTDFSTPDFGEGSNLIEAFPFSSISTNTGTGMRVIGWRRYTDTVTGNVWWIPRLLLETVLGYTSSGSGSVPNYTIDGSSVRTFSQITQTSATPGANLYTPGSYLSTDVTAASVVVDTAGSELVTVNFKSSATGSPNMGVFWAIL
jgi:hypothetical protein